MSMILTCMSSDVPKTRTRAKDKTRARAKDKTRARRRLQLKLR